MGRYRGELGSEGRHEVCGSGMRGSRAAALTSTLDSPGSDDLLVDNEEGMLGKVSILSFYLHCHIFFHMCITLSFDLEKKVLWMLADIVLQKYYHSGRYNTYKIIRAHTTTLGSNK